MTRFVRRLAAGVAVALVPMAAVTVAAAGVGSAECDPNWSHIVVTKIYKPPPPPPAWWTPPPAYAPIYAPQSVAAAPSTAAVGAVAPPPPGMGRGSSAVGLGGVLTAPSRLALGH